jgi:hypothetical protein
MSGMHVVHQYLKLKSSIKQCINAEDICEIEAAEVMRNRAGPSKVCEREILIVAFSSFSPDEIRANRPNVVNRRDHRVIGNAGAPGKSQSSAAISRIIRHQSLA